MTPKVQAELNVTQLCSLTGCWRPYRVSSKDVHGHPVHGCSAAHLEAAQDRRVKIYGEEPNHVH